jgi:hypothetical protein
MSRMIRHIRMVRFGFLSLFFVFTSTLFSQNPNRTKIAGSTLLGKLKIADSLVYYQCHVDSASQLLYTASGQTLSSKSKNISITEKFVLFKTEQGYFMRRYSSPLTILPNRRFSGLKFGEKPYWEFRFESAMDLDETQVKILQAIELNGREATEYDYPVTLANTNQLIVLYGKKLKQLNLERNHLLSKLYKK